MCNKPKKMLVVLLNINIIFELCYVYTYMQYYALK